MFKTLRILIVNPETVDRDNLERDIWDHGFVPVCCETLAAAKERIAREEFSVILCAEMLPDADFRAVIREARRYGCEAPVIVVSRRAEWDAYLEALGEGAFDYVALPPHPAELERILLAALREAAHMPELLKQAA
jgi:DNA-binding response OmpR family regulator